MTFNVVETNLMCIYNTGSRSALIQDMKASLPDVYDDELRETMEEVISKLERITDEGFSEIAFHADFGDDTEEQEG